VSLASSSDRDAFGVGRDSDICSLVFDETDILVTPGYDAANKIPGYEKCATKSVEFLERMQERKAALEARLAKGYGPVLPPR